MSRRRLQSETRESFRYLFQRYPTNDFYLLHVSNLDSNSVEAHQLKPDRDWPNPFTIRVVMPAVTPPGRKSTRRSPLNV